MGSVSSILEQQLPMEFTLKSTCVCVLDVYIYKKKKLTIIDDADHHSMTCDVVGPDWHHVQVDATRAVLTLYKLHTHTYKEW